jgi:hypothetical protein
LPLELLGLQAWVIVLGRFLDFCFWGTFILIFIVTALIYISINTV